MRWYGLSSSATKHPAVERFSSASRDDSAVTLKLRKYHVKLVFTGQTTRFLRSRVRLSAPRICLKPRCFSQHVYNGLRVQFPARAPIVLGVATVCAALKLVKSIGAAVCLVFQRRAPRYKRASRAVRIYPAITTNHRRPFAWTHFYLQKTHKFVSTSPSVSPQKRVWRQRHGFSDTRSGKDRGELWTGHLHGGTTELRS